MMGGTRVLMGLQSGMNLTSFKSAMFRQAQGLEFTRRGQTISPF